MTSGEKASFCVLASMLMAPPEDRLLEELGRKELRPWLEGHSTRWGGEGQVTAGLFEYSGGDVHRAELATAYDRLFGQWGGPAVSLVESTYKPWALDGDCGMVFSGATGLIMGDSAVHMNELYRRTAIEVPGHLKSTPDHIVLLMEFLSMLYDECPEEHARSFLNNHLDWVPLLKVRTEAADPHPFYRSAVSLIDLFVKEQQSNRKSEDHGPSNIH